jgi:hypothetical protein
MNGEQGRAGQGMARRNNNNNNNNNEDDDASSIAPKKKKRRGPRARKVEQVDLKTGEVINVYDSLNHAAEEIGCSYSNISHVLVGKSKSAKVSIVLIHMTTS